MKAALYARYSSDQQSATSTADQLRLCRIRAEQESLAIIGEWYDDAVSGSTPVRQRDGGRQLLAAALEKRFDVLILEGLDRLSRDSVEQEQLIRRLEHRGIRIIGIADGYDSQSKTRKLHRGMRGLINEVYLDDLREKTRRGLAGRVARGHHAGGMAYGYTSTGDDLGKTLQINPEQARTVLEIFRRYAQGESCQRIASDLNARGVPGPRGTWAVSALYGSPRKGTGILNNDLYRGLYIWNRSQWTKDPDTGKRTRIERPRDEWQKVERPDLRIVPDELWNAARERIQSGAAQSGSRGKGARPSTLLGGLMVCGTCGGAFVAINQTKYGCATHKDRGPAVCPSRLLIRRDVADERIVGALRADLLSPESIACLQREVQARLSERQPRDHGKRIAELDAEIRKLVDAIAAVGISPALAERLKKAEAERDRLLNDKPPPPIKIDDVARRYRDMVARLDETLRSDVQQSRSILARLLGPVRIDQDDTGPFARIETPTTRLLMVAGVDGIGSGGAITDPSTARKVRL